MTIIKCKMCGGELKIVPESSICECEYCGSKQTIPTTDDEKRLKLYERANKLRYENEFDKAVGVYESIVAEYQDEAEAYWGLVLCKYGIEYVDDPKTGKKIPTCHRSSFNGVFEDPNFDFVMENADSVAVDLYRDEAKQIEELRKAILAVSSQEEPYDIFICYKETDENGERTIDSVLAQNVFNLLEDNDYKVFFSRITLEDKLGREYEPYIFSALNTAKVMLAFGTSYKNYNSVWVKNEWSRFLQLMENDPNKVLIPCFKDIDVYDMPKEFAVLQAQDLGKVGALQDLLRGIDKIFGRDKRSNSLLINNIVGDGNALAKRGYFALEDGEWDKAIEYFDQALNQDAENAEIHLGLFLAKRRMVSLDSFFKVQLNNLERVSSNSLLACKPNEEFINRVVQNNVVEGYFSEKMIYDQFLYKLTYDSLVNGLEQEKCIYNDKDWTKAERFAKGELKEKINALKNKHLDEIDRRILKEKQGDLIKANKIENEYSNFLEATENSVIEQKYKAEAAKENYYISVCNKIKQAKSKLEYQAIMGELHRLNGYKDSQMLIDDCEKQIIKINEREKEKRDIHNQKIKKIYKKITIAVAIITVLVIVGIVGYRIYEKKVIIPQQEYNNACELMDKEDYQEAIWAFEKLGGYKDSDSKIEQCNNAISEREQKEYDDKYKEIVDLVDSDSYKSAVESLSTVNDDNERNRILNYMVDDIYSRYEMSENDELKLITANGDFMRIIDFLTDDQKSKLASINDRKFIEVGLDGCDVQKFFSGKTNSLYEKIVNKELIDKDCELIKKYKNNYYEAFQNFVYKTDVYTGFVEETCGQNNSVYFDKDSHSLYFEIYPKKDSSIRMYIVTGGDDYLIVGETVDEGKYKIKNNGEMELLDEPLIQKNETFFNDILD